MVLSLIIRMILSLFILYLLGLDLFSSFIGYVLLYIVLKSEITLGFRDGSERKF